MLVVLPLFGTEIATYMLMESDRTEKMNLKTEELYAFQKGGLLIKYDPFGPTILGQHGTLGLNLMEIQKQHKNNTNKPQLKGG